MLSLSPPAICLLCSSEENHCSWYSISNGGSWDRWDLLEGSIEQPGLLGQGAGQSWSLPLSVWSLFFSLGSLLHLDTHPVAQPLQLASAWPRCNICQFSMILLALLGNWKPFSLAGLALTDLLVKADLERVAGLQGMQDFAAFSNPSCLHCAGEDLAVQDAFCP